ncbi:MAG: amidase [Meiothermus sp.]|nr:amidase [Meiothermus sp.]
MSPRVFPSHPLLSKSAVEQAELIRRGEVSSSQLVEASLEAVAANQDLNAVVWLDAEGALAQAKAVAPGDPRPFAGVPMLIKELTPVAGQPWRMGSRLFAQHKAPADAFTVRRLREAGFVLIGQSASPEFGIVPVTEGSLHGPTRNPWDLDRTPGGSSGGAAAAVAAGILSAAHASDGGGSIRIPAACCGLVGLKASRGRLSAGPFVGDSFLGIQGVVSRTVADSARLLDVLQGYEVGDSTWAPPPAATYAEALRQPPGPLRVAALSVAPTTGLEPDPLTLAGVRKAAELLERHGHAVEWAQPPGWVNPRLIEQFTALWASGVASNTLWGASLQGRPPRPDDVEALTWYFTEMGMKLPAVAYLNALESLKNYARGLVGFFQKYDLLLTPTLAERPLPIGELNTEAAEPLSAFNRAEAFTPYTATWNVTGQPAVSLPLFAATDGLPVGVQLVAAPLREDLLLALAAQLEATHGWNRPL